MAYKASLREWSVSPRLGKSIFGHKCHPTKMKQEGTSAMGRQKKMAPAAHSGLNYNRARITRDLNRYQGRHSLREREAYYQILDFLVNRDLKDLAAYVACGDLTRQMLRTQYNGQARRLSSQGYIVVNGSIVRTAA